jgi:hypothetical protein
MSNLPATLSDLTRDIRFAVIPTSVGDRVDQLKSLKTFEAVLKELRTRLNDSLQSEIQPGAQIDGILHLEVSRSTTAWKRVYDKIYQDVLDRDQRRKATTIRNEFVSMTRYSTFKET